MPIVTKIIKKNGNTTGIATNEEKGYSLINMGGNGYLSWEATDGSIVYTMGTSIEDSTIGAVAYTDLPKGLDLLGGIILEDLRRRTGRNVLTDVPHELLGSVATEQVMRAHYRALRDAELAASDPP